MFLARAPVERNVSLGMEASDPLLLYFCIMIVMPNNRKRCIKYLGTALVSPGLQAPMVPGVVCQDDHTEVCQGGIAHYERKP